MSSILLNDNNVIILSILHC